VFLSLVHSARAGPLPLLDRPETRQRFNVAASRAREQLWVVYALDPATDLKPADLRRRLIEHALDPGALTRTLASAAQRTESVFERLVLEHLVRRHYRVTPQWAVGRYRIDLVVEGGGRRLALECDGDRYHPPEKLPEDMARQALLERLGWRFLRLRGSVFFRDPEGTMAKVCQRLEELGIPPEGIEREALATSSNSDLVQELTRRAAQLRHVWQAAETNRSAEPCGCVPAACGAQPVLGITG
jgi:very-short-patch-repair endonuclease